VVSGPIDDRTTVKEKTTQHFRYYAHAVGGTHALNFPKKKKIPKYTEIVVKTIACAAVYIHHIIYRVIQNWSSSDDLHPTSSPADLKPCDYLHFEDMINIYRHTVYAYPIISITIHRGAKQSLQLFQYTQMYERLSSDYRCVVNGYLLPFYKFEISSIHSMYRTLHNNYSLNLKTKHFCMHFRSDESHV